MSGEELISIIVPVYNLENYIDDCIKSIQRQTYANFEVLVVNDGSTDRSLNIAEEFAILDKRIKTVDIENSGVTRARYEGVKQSKGNYIVFIDGDDSLPEDSLEKLLTGFKENSDVDIVVSGYDIVDDNGNFVSQVKYNYGLLDRLQYQDFIFGIGNQASPWAKMFKRSLITEYAFKFKRSINVREDALMNFVISIGVNSVKIIDSSCYLYRVREGSAVNSFSNKIDYYLNYYFTLCQLALFHKVPVSNQMKIYSLRILTFCMMNDIRNGNRNRDSFRKALKIIDSSDVDFDMRTKLKIKFIKLYNFIR